MSRKADVLVVGGGSRIGAALAGHLGARAIVAVRQSGGHANERRVADYAAVPPAMFEGIERVVNCVGTSVGQRDLLDRVNVDIPLKLAATARQAGVRQFIHVSSLSVYGGATLIDRDTQAAPSSNYGHTKLAADRGLLALAGPGFDVAVLRLPLIYAHASEGKLGQLLRLWRRIRILPVPTGDIRRAMIGVDLTAEVMACLIAQAPSNGILFAADPRPFTYADTARARAEALYRIPLPQGATRAAHRIAPTIADRLFADSRLDDADNLAVAFGLSSRLYRDIAAATP